MIFKTLRNKKTGEWVHPPYEGDSTNQFWTSSRPWISPFATKKEIEREYCCDLSDYELIPVHLLTDEEYDKRDDLLKECILQLEYLCEKFGETGTGNSLISRLKSVVDS